VKSSLARKPADKTLTAMDWPPQSPDLNIIEAVWDHLDRERNKRQPTSKEELWEVLKEAWYNIPEDYFRKLQDSLPKRVQDVLRAKGGHTKHFCPKKPFCSENCVCLKFVHIFPVFSVCDLVQRPRSNYG